MKKVITVDKVGKKYIIGHLGKKRDTTFRDVLVKSANNVVHKTLNLFKNTNRQMKKEEFWALKDVSFDICQGDRIGIIGRNGAGKSTLLKILSRITEPTEGTIRLTGRVASLLEVGTGFHPELTGRENIFLNGAILGMSKGEIKRKFDEIVAFSEIEKFLDTPVKRYSSGMYVRLAFAVAAHLEPEILIVDEVLAVGDAQFQEKCMGKMHTMGTDGRTVLFVSHNMNAISALTQKTIYLDKGKVIDYGLTNSVIQQYLKNGLQKQINTVNHTSYDIEYFRRDKVTEGTPAFIRNVNIINQGAALTLNEDIEISIEIESRRKINGANFTFFIKNEDGVLITTIFSWDYNFQLNLNVGLQQLNVSIRGATFTPGQYFVTMGINQSVDTIAYDCIMEMPFFKIENRNSVAHWVDRPWGNVYFNNIMWTLIEK